MARESGVGRSARVLVVEDDESSALFVTRALERGGFRPTWVANGEEAEKKLAAEAFDALLTDVRLPGMTGLDLVEEARHLVPSIGIAVMTSCRKDELERSARSSGADDFFEKPLRSENLVARVARLVEGSRAAVRRQPGRTPVKGASIGGPAMAAPEVPRGGGTSGWPLSAGNGPGERPPAWRGGASADTDRCGETGTHLQEGTGGASRARFPHPAGDGLRPAGTGRRGRPIGEAVSMRASGFPRVHVGSVVRSVAHPRTGPASPSGP